MDVGDTVTVLWGTHAGVTGKIAKLGATFVDLEIPDEEDPDWPSHAFVDLEQLRPEEPQVSIARAVRGRRAYGWQLRRFWLAEVLRDEPRDLATLVTEYAAHARPIERACDAAIAAELARWEAATEGLDAAARDAKWQAERAEWTEWHPAGDVAYLAIVAELLPDTPEDQRASRVEELFAQARELEDRADSHATRTKLAQPIADEARDDQLEHQIEVDVDRDDAFVVYADWLQSQGNRRGEWIALSAAGSSAASTLRKELAVQLLGPLADLEHRLDTRWRLGYLDAITLATTRDDEEGAGLNVVDLLRIALALPTCRFVRELTIGLPSVHERLSVTDTLVAAGPRPALRRLALTTNQEEEMLSWTAAGDLAPLVELYPNLVSLEVTAGSYALAAPALPKLQRLVLQTCDPPAGIALAIARAEWPVLEELELWFGSKAYDVQLAIGDLAPLLEAPLPRLRRLGLCNCEVTDELCELLLATPLLPRLDRLSLAKGTLTEVGAELLVTNAERLTHLRELDVDQNFLDEATLGRLRAAGIPIKTSWQRTADVWDGVTHRYAAVGE